MLRLLPIAALLWLAGCPEGTPELSVAPASLDFGELPVGETASLTVTVSNTGTASSVVSFSVDDPFAVVLTGAIEVGPGDNRTIFVEASPRAVGTAAGVLTVAWNQARTEVALTVTGTEGLPDVDGDGFSTATDCDDTDPDVNPEATEACNGVDDDCDEDTDEGFDGDGDGVTSCGADGQAGTADDDCDDGDADSFPGADEVCDGVDNDCDTLLDEDFDADADSYTTCEDDCDDGDPAVHPGAAELCNGLDDDCDTTVDNGFDDLDGDGEAFCTDCDDGDATVAHGLPELCDGLDNDCDTDIDEGFVDADVDTYTTCDDCDDGNGAVFPGAAQACDGASDNDCDGVTDANELDGDSDGASACGGDCDDGDPALNVTDGDSDGVTTCDAPADCDDGDGNNFPGNIEACDGLDNDCSGAPESSVDGDGDNITVCAGDCDDTNAAVNPGATEVCDGLDNNCDTVIDEGFVDGDSDGAAGCVDCDDNDPTSFPGATELCDGADNDCDTDTDEGFDTDGDGAFDGAIAGCAATYGAAADCDDGNGAVYPGAPDVCDAVADNDCSGAPDPLESDDDTDGVSECDGDCDDGAIGVNPNDADNDGVSTCDTVIDCDDNDPANFPGNPELCDGADNDCDTLVDETFDTDTDGAFDGAVTACVTQYGAAAIDCNDGSGAVHPGAADVCDAFADNNCDGVDDPLESDDDGDGESECGGDCDDVDPALSVADVDGDGSTTCDVTPDCDDTDPDQFPTATEECSGVDQDCDNVDPLPCGTCRQVLEADPVGRAGLDGLWEIDPDGPNNGDDPFDAECDLTTDGGGWTLIERAGLDGPANAALITNYATWYGSNIGSAASGPHRIAGKHWETLAGGGLADEVMAVYTLQTPAGVPCTPLPYILGESVGGLFTIVSTFSAQYAFTGADPGAIVNGSTTAGAQTRTLSTTDAGPRTDCVNNGQAAPWFYYAGTGTCGHAFLTLTEFQSFGNPQRIPYVRNQSVLPAAADASCGNTAPLSTLSWYRSYQHEHYVR